MSKRSEKRVNLADRAAAMEALKQLYGNKEVKDDRRKLSTERESGTTSTGEVVKLSPGS